MLSAETVRDDMNYAINETGKTVKHRRYTYTTESIYGTPTATSLALNEDIKVKWSRVDKNLKVLELGNYDIGDVIAICKNAVDIRTDDLFFEDFVEANPPTVKQEYWSAKYKVLRTESANIGGILVYTRAILKKVVN